MSFFKKKGPEFWQLYGWPAKSAWMCKTTNAGQLLVTWSSQMLFDQLIWCSTAKKYTQYSGSRSEDYQFTEPTLSRHCVCKLTTCQAKAHHWRCAFHVTYYSQSMWGVITDPVTHLTTVMVLKSMYIQQSLVGRRWGWVRKIFLGWEKCCRLISSCHDSQRRTVCLPRAKKMTM